MTFKLKTERVDEFWVIKAKDYDVYFVTWSEEIYQKDPSELNKNEYCFSQAYEFDSENKAKSFLSVHTTLNQYYEVLRVKQNINIISEIGV